MGGKGTFPSLDHTSSGISILTQVLVTMVPLLSFVFNHLCGLILLCFSSFTDCFPLSLGVFLLLL